MSTLYKQQKRAVSAPAVSSPETAAPVMIGNQSMEALMRGTEIPSAGNMGHRVDLPGAIRAKMENAFGADFGGVQLYESQAVADAGANAVVMGGRIAFAPGKLDFSSSGGQTLLGHELSHVVSQARGEASGRGFLSDRALEARADREGALAAAGESVYTGPVTPLSASSVAAAAGPMQASKKDKKDREQATQIMQGVIRDSDSNTERHARNMEAYDNALRGSKKAQKTALVPYYDTNGDRTEVPLSRYKKLLKADAKDTPNVDLKHMNSKSMLKNAKNLRSLANDFKGLEIKNIKGVLPGPDTISQNALMSADFDSRNIQINSDSYRLGMRIASEKRINGKFGFATANDNYALAHEAGHNVNYQLADKLHKTAENNGKQTSDGQLGGSDGWSMWEASKAIIADTLTSQATMDENLDRLLRDQLKLAPDQALDDPAVLKQIVGALNTDLDNGYGSDLLTALYDAGYTSEYGSSSSMELFAEAFADHYRNEAKESRYSARGKKGKTDLDKLRKNRNYFSDMLVQRARELFDDEEKRKAFLDKFI